MLELDIWTLRILSRIHEGINARTHQQFHDSAVCGSHE